MLSAIVCDALYVIVVKPTDANVSIKKTEIMNNRQTNTLNMYNAVSQFLNTYNAVWSGNATIAGMVTTFNGHISALNASDMAQKTITNGITQSKQQAKITMAKAAMVIAKAGKAYANATNNYVLAANFIFAQSDILRAKDTDADDICQGIHDALQPFIASTAPYGANAASQTNLQNAINTFSALIGRPRSQRTIVINATLSIAERFEATNTLLKDQLDPIMVQFKTTNAPFYNQYKAARVIVDVGNHHTVILRGFIYDASTNMAVANATVRVSGAANSAKITDATGIYNFVRLQPGDYTLTVSAPGYGMQTKSINVKEDGVVETDFKMIAVINSSNDPNNSTN